MNKDRDNKMDAKIYSSDITEAIISMIENLTNQLGEITKNQNTTAVQIQALTERQSFINQKIENLTDKIDKYIEVSVNKNLFEEEISDLNDKYNDIKSKVFLLEQEFLFKKTLKSNIITATKWLSGFIVLVGACYELLKHGFKF